VVKVPSDGVIKGDKLPVCLYIKLIVFCWGWSLAFSVVYVLMKTKSEFEHTLLLADVCRINKILSSVWIVRLPRFYLKKFGKLPPTYGYAYWCINILYVVCVLKCYKKPKFPPI